MSAEILRRAAALMRERTITATPGPWGASWDNQVVAACGSPAEGEQLADCFDGGGNVLHIASWHPAVALAVAKVMDDVALAWEICDDGWTRDMDGDAIRFEDTVDGGWLTVARAYLGSQS